MGNNYFVSTDGGGDGGSAGLYGFLSGNAYVANGIMWIRALQAITINKITIGAIGPPAGSSLIGDILYHATDPDSAISIFATTPANRPTLPVGQHTADSGTPDTTAIDEDGWLGLSVDQVGSTTPGSGIAFSIKIS